MQRPFHSERKEGGRKEVVAGKFSVGLEHAKFCAWDVAMDWGGLESSGRDVLSSCCSSDFRIVKIPIARATPQRVKNSECLNTFCTLLNS